MNILIVKLSAIGDVIMSLPFLDALRQTFPKAQLTWLVEEAASDVVLEHPQVDRVLVSRRRQWQQRAGSGHLASVTAEVRDFLGQLRSCKYDLVIDLQGLFKSGLLAWLSGGGRRVGFDKTREFSYLFLNERLKPYDPDRHALLRYLDVAVYLGADPSRPVNYTFPVSDDAAREALRLAPPTRRLTVILNPGAKWRTKLWPVAHWRTLAGMLLEETGVRLILTGGPGEETPGRGLIAEAGRLLDLTGRTRIKVLAEVFRGADLVVCPDTGPMHLAAAVGTPVAALFGPTSDLRTGPFGVGHLVLEAGSECRPCFRKACDHTRCMNDLSPLTVFQAVVKKLDLA